MKTFEIEITETLQRIIEIEAKSEDEAYQTVLKKYKNEEIILDDSDFINKEINSYLYSEKHDELYNNQEFKNFVLREAEKTLTHMSIEELTKLAFGDISNAKNIFSK